MLHFLLAVMMILLVFYYFFFFDSLEMGMEKDSNDMEEGTLEIGMGML